MTVIVVEYARRYPPTADAPNLMLFAAFEPAKLGRMLWALLVVAGINASAGALGVAVLRVAGPIPRDTGERRILAIAYGFIVLPLAVLLLAAANSLTHAWLVALLVVPPASAIAWSIAIRRRRALPKEGRPGPAWSQPALVALLLAGSFLAAFDPAPGWDALTYHLALPERYLFHGQIFMSPFFLPSAFPSASEMLYALAISMGDEAAARLLHLEFGVLTLVAVGRLAARSSPLAGWLAPFWLLSDPLFLNETTWALNDLPVAFYSMLAFASLLEFRDSTKFPDLARAGVFAGACAATRYLGGSVALGVLALVLWQERSRPRRMITATVVLAGASMIPLLPWLMRNWALTGNPVAPLLQGFFYEPGHEYFHPTAIAQVVAFTSRIGMGTGIGAYLLSPWNVTLETIPGQYKNSFGFLIGPLALAGVGAALLRSGAWKDARIRAGLGFLFVTFTIWFLTFQESRYLVPLMPIAAWLGAVTAAELAARDRASRALIFGLVVLALGLAQLRELPSLPRRYAFALGSRSPRDANALDPMQRAADFLRTELRPGERVLPVLESRSFLLRGIDFIPYYQNEGAPTLQLLHESEDEDAFHCRLVALGVTHVVINRNTLRRSPPTPIDGYDARAIAADVDRLGSWAARSADVIWSEDGVSVLRLEPRACRPRS